MSRTAGMVMSAFPSVILSACLSLSVFPNKYVLAVPTVLQTPLGSPFSQGLHGVRSMDVV